MKFDVFYAFATTECLILLDHLILLAFAFAVNVRQYSGVKCYSGKTHVAFALLLCQVTDFFFTNIRY